MDKIGLYVIATPIGNLSDISARAIATLREVDFILCEDTRQTAKLLRAHGISKELVSFNAQTETKKIERVIERINSGESCAVVSDSGTPCISDPGVRLVNAVQSRNIKVSGAPGPNAAIFALSISGIPTDSFVFEGFLPQKKGRQKKLSELSREHRTIVLYESTYRIEKLLNELLEYMPNRFISVCREMTKMYEEIWRGYPKQLLDQIGSKTLKGEFVVIISPIDWSTP